MAYRRSSFPSFSSSLSFLLLLFHALPLPFSLFLCARCSTPPVAQHSVSVLPARVRANHISQLLTPSPELTASSTSPGRVYLRPTELDVRLEDGAFGYTGTGGTLFSCSGSPSDEPLLAQGRVWPRCQAFGKAPCQAFLYVPVDAMRRPRSRNDRLCVSPMLSRVGDRPSRVFAKWR